MKRRNSCDDHIPKKLKTCIDPKNAVLLQANAEYELGLEQIRLIDLHFHEQRKGLDDAHQDQAKRLDDQWSRLLKDAHSMCDKFYDFLDGSSKHSNKDFQLNHLVELSRKLTSEPTQLNLMYLREINKFLASAYHERISFIPLPLPLAGLGHFPLKNDFYGKVISLGTDLPYQNREYFAQVIPKTMTHTRPSQSSLISLGSLVFRFMLWPTKKIVIQVYRDLRYTQTNTTYECCR